jgi:hypothetical protein
MHRQWPIDCRNHLRKGSCVLHVAFAEFILFLENCDMCTINTNAHITALIAAMQLNALGSIAPHSTYLPASSYKISSRKFVPSCFEKRSFWDVIRATDGIHVARPLCMIRRGKTELAIYQICARRWLPEVKDVERCLWSRNSRASCVRSGGSFPGLPRLQ